MSEDGSDCQWRGMLKNIKWEEKHPAIWSQVPYYFEVEGESSQQYMKQFSKALYITKFVSEKLGF